MNMRNAIDYLLKPIDGERLLEAVDEAFSVRNGERLPLSDEPSTGS